MKQIWNQKNIAEAVVEKKETNDGVYILHSPLYFATDNCNFQNDTLDEKHWRCQPSTYNKSTIIKPS